MTGLSTLCYIEKNGKYLMLHRTVKKNDVNREKWIGVGGHFEQDESPEECLLREVREETGYTLTSWRYRGIVTFVSGDGVTEYMSLFTADGFEGEPIPCDEGELAWVDIEDVWKLNIWEGDKIFFRLIDEEHPFFSLKLTYDGRGHLTAAALDGKPMELFDILNPDGSRTGLIRERGVAHREGSLHAAAHIWVLRPGASGRAELLLQKCSGYVRPGCCDISLTAHPVSGESTLDAAIRELSARLNIKAAPEHLHFLGTCHSVSEDIFREKPFRDNELRSVYLYIEPVDLKALTPEFTDPTSFTPAPAEAEEFFWIDFDKCLRGVRENIFPNCISADELRMLETYLNTHAVF